MKNADMPAMPFEIVDEPQSRWWGGLTKREMMAMHILPSLVQSYDVGQVATEGQTVVRDAVIYADLLLVELEKSCPTETT
jgi:hypothetical protein